METLRSPARSANSFALNRKEVVTSKAAFFFNQSRWMHNYLCGWRIFKADDWMEELTAPTEKNAYDCGMGGGLLNVV